MDSFVSSEFGQENKPTSSAGGLNLGENQDGLIDKYFADHQSHKSKEEDL